MMIKIPNNFNEFIRNFEEILTPFNKIHSLTNYKNFQNVAIDSVDGLKFISKNPKICVDVGSGAGIPAIFLAFILKDCEFHLFEPNFKKSAFLTLAKVELKLQNIKIHTKKIENSQKFKADLITSRALMKVPNLIKICDGFYDETTEFLLYKGTNFENEIENFNAKIFNQKNRNYILISGVKC